MRVGSLRRSTLLEALFRPFNEHMAPLFEVVSWLSWEGGGGRVAAMPVAFLVASYLAFGLGVGLIWALIRFEARSRTAAMGGVAIFCLSSVSAETVLWYSASSFQWALDGTLAAWLAATMAISATSNRRRRLAWLLAATLAAMAAPGFSAIGILAAPLSSLRLLIGGRVEPRMSARTRVGMTVLPMVGLGLYLAICSCFRYQDVVGQSLARNLDPGPAVLATLRAPTMVLIPSLLGPTSNGFACPTGIAAGLTLVLLGGCLIWSARSADRPLILGGIAMIAGGYLLTFAARARPDDLWILKVPRYHLFPLAGMVCTLAGVCAPISRWLDRGPTRGLLAVAALAVGLAFAQYPGMRRAAEVSYRFPGQGRLLLAEAKLEAIASREGITLTQAMKAIDPIEPRWAPASYPFHPILFLFPKDAGPARLPDGEVRAAFIAGLDLEELALIFGGMDASPYARPASSWTQVRPPIATRLVGVHGLETLGAGRYRASGPGYLEFRADDSPILATAVCLPGLAVRSRRPIEIWWSDGGDGWSSERSVRWTVDRDGQGGDRAVSLADLPHWRAGSGTRIRLVLRDLGEISVGSPQFLR